ncbi:MAG: thiamine pyrophosphate-binding protein [SAR324 cluster bacterium]|nr:thiamine pyrophosphate-binding protein [SAR324 cluster bacterium]
MTSRRDFLKGVAAAGTLSGLASKSEAQAAQAETQTRAAVSALPPSSYVEAMESDVPGYSEADVAHYFVRHAASDFMVDVIKSLGIDYIASNPGSSHRGLQESLVNYGGNTKPEWLTCLHEESSIAICQGYAKVAYKPMAMACHSTVGLQHASMAIYNAYCDRVPLIVFGGNHLDAAERRPGAEWSHSAQDAAKLVRDFVKWDDTPVSVTHFVESVMRAYKIATTPPMGPVFLSMPGDILDAEGEVEFGAPTRVDAATRPSQAALEHLADRLLAASAPVILAGQELNTSDALAEAVELAELLGAAVYQQTVTSTTHFPSEHPLFMGAMTRLQHVARETLEHYDLLFALGADVLRMGPHGSVDPLPEGMPLVQVAQRDWELGKNYPTEIALKADVRETLRALLPVVAAKRTQRQAEAAAKRAKALVENNWSARRESLRAKTMELAEVKPIQPDYLMMRIAEELPKDAVIVEEGIPSTRNLLAFHALRDAHCFYGLATGGIGFAIAGAIGVQLALPDRPVMCLVGDGSAMYSIQALWTAAHLNLPIKFVITNNRSYRILKERLAAYQGDSFRQENFIGMDLRNPAIDFAALAQSMGVPAHSISDPEAVVPALREALSASGPVLLDVQVFDGYVS